MGQFLSKSNQSPSQPPADEKDREIARLREQVEAQQRDLWACNAHIRYLEQDLDNERQMNDDAEMRRQDSYDRAATRTDEREERGGDQHQQQQQQQQQQQAWDSRQCFKCKKSGHIQPDCPENLCWTCGRPGHMSFACGDRYQ